MAAAIAETRWEATPLGPIETWPAALKVSISTMVNSAFPKCLCWGPELVAIYNDAFIPILGDKHPCLGHPFSAIWSEAWDEIRPIVERAMTGEATFIEDFPLVIQRSDHREEAYFTFCYSPIRDEHGTVRGMLDTVIETTGKVRAERLARLRNHELIHRSRNVYAVVSALVNQTHRTSTTKEEARDKIQKRLTSLIRAQDILAGTETAEANVARVVERALEPFADVPGAVETRGPEVTIGLDQVTSLVLALHELATNAAKYGALSRPGGCVSVTWGTADADGRSAFWLDWIESGGPAVARPERRGFGSFLIEQALEQAFGGSVAVTFNASGLHFTLRAEPRDRAFAAPADAWSDPGPSEQNGQPTTALAGAPPGAGPPHRPPPETPRA